MGALLHNPSPGESFKAGDLVRNLMLAAVANETLEEQEAFYKKYWLQLGFPVRTILIRIIRIFRGIRT